MCLHKCVSVYKENNILNQAMDCQASLRIISHQYDVF